MASKEYMIADAMTEKINPEKLLSIQIPQPNFSFIYFLSAHSPSGRAETESRNYVYGTPRPDWDFVISWSLLLVCSGAYCGLCGLSRIFVFTYY